MKENMMIEVNNSLKKLEKNNRLRTIVFIGAGVALIVGIIVFLVIKMREKLDEHAYDNYDYNDWDDYDDSEFEDYSDYEEFADSEDGYEAYEEA